ncbi:hypothetical protein RB195_023985 [Necator americanus]|uniref:Uncharacterized protein n=1 Tax=Necator americanus TaxID=51031 RepID=A0ABR1ELG6_NECAM
MWRVSTAPLLLVAVLSSATDLEEQVYDLPGGEYTEYASLLDTIPQSQHISSKRVDMDSDMPGVFRFGKREDHVKKSVPGVLRFGKRSNKKSVPGVLRFGKRSVPHVLLLGKRGADVFRFGKRNNVNRCSTSNVPS